MRGLAGVVGAVVALVLAWPESVRPFTLTGHVASTLDVALRGTEGPARLTLGQSRLVEAFHPADFAPEVPHDAFAAPGILWPYYAERAAREGRGGGVYRIQPARDPVPAGAEVRGALNGLAALVLDPLRAAEHAALRPPTPAGAPLLRTSRCLMFPGQRGTSGLRILDLRRLARRVLGRD